jgi:hypothetical protein
MSRGSGSSELLVKPVVTLMVDLIMGIEFNMSKFGDTRAMLMFEGMYVFSHTNTSGLELIPAEAFFQCGTSRV